MTEKPGHALIIGAGIGGIKTALDLAEAGFGVTLMDKAPHPEGILARLDRQFPNNRCGMCRMLPSMERGECTEICLRRGLFHDRIDLLVSTRIESLEGTPGNFTAILKTQNQFIDPDLCNGCGICENLCPETRKDSFNQGLSSSKAVYLPTPHLMGNSFRIDPEACTLCGKCVEACPTGAITLPGSDKHKFTILAVDDEMVVRDSLAEWFQEDGYTTLMAESGPEALTLIEQDSSIALMFLDIKMPGMDGIEVLEKALEMRPDLSVVMMTAYATVETAVDAMKIGAREYVMKPFDPDTLLPLIQTIYEEKYGEGEKMQELEVDLVVLATGTGYYDPLEGKNPFGYGIFPGVLTGLELERMMNPAGPTQGKLQNSQEGRPIQRMAWIQCVGSRDIQNGLGYCSSICCMHAVKEAMMAKEMSGGKIDTVIYYMDLRCFGKSHDLYRTQAEEKWGIRFKRARPHSLIMDGKTHELIMHVIDDDLSQKQEQFDMVVLSLGQRPAQDVEKTCEILGLEPGIFGFPTTENFTTQALGREGVFLAGSSAGLMDIAGTITRSGAVAGEACTLLHSLNKSPISPSPALELRDVSREIPRIFVAICQCPKGEQDENVLKNLKAAAAAHPHTVDVVLVKGLCTQEGWQTLSEKAQRKNPNRVLIAACMPHIFSRRFKELGLALSLDHSLIQGVDILNFTSSTSSTHYPAGAIKELEMALTRIRHQKERPEHVVETIQRILVLGGGIAGMTAALTVADQGREAVLVERSQTLGGNLNWLHHGVHQEDFKKILEELVEKITAHPLIQIHTGSNLEELTGEAGRFHSLIQNKNQIVPLDHGAVIMATGGHEAKTNLYGHGTHPGILTQKELTEALTAKTIEPAQLSSVVMIQCVGSRDQSRPYCSRICCPGALKHAFTLIEANPDLTITIIYRDLMTPGFDELLFKEAREKGIIFIAYTPQAPPKVALENDVIQVTVKDPILNQQLQLETSLVVLATGVVPDIPQCFPKHIEPGENRSNDMAGELVDEMGFFKEIDPKWRPMDSPKEGIFACGLALGPRDVEESAATAKAAAQRALRVMGKPQIKTWGQVSETKTGLCTLCLRCVTACAFGARILDQELEEIRVNPILCQGCGSCASACPSNAAHMPGFAKQEMYEILDRAV